jgi:aryl-alcohol dehydrogenase-like predicted oxidoreductase
VIATKFGFNFVDADFRNDIPRFAPENRKANQALVDLTRRIAQRKGQRPRRSHWRGC